ncbi:hypothetical protein ACI3LZ_000402 [Candidozyma auris]
MVPDVSETDESNPFNEVTLNQEGDLLGAEKHKVAMLRSFCYCVMGEDVVD